MPFKGFLIVRLGPYFTWLNISGFQSPWDHFWGRNRILKLNFKKSDAPKILRWAKVVWAHPPKNPDVFLSHQSFLGVRPHYLWPSQNFWCVELLKLQFQNAVTASKMVPWALKPRNIEPRKIWAQSDYQKTFKTHFEVYFSCLFTLLLVNSNQKSK